MAQEHVFIRPANGDDAAQLALLAAQTFHKTYADFNTSADMDYYLSTHFTPEAIAKDLETPDVNYYLLFAGTQLAGYIKLQVADTPYIEANTGLEVSRFYVDQAHQGAGYGRMLMNQAEVNARMLNKQVIWLSVWKRNPRSVNIYTSLGYTIVGETIFQLGSDAQEDYIMIKRL